MVEEGGSLTFDLRGLVWGIESEVALITSLCRRIDDHVRALNGLRAEAVAAGEPAAADFEPAATAGRETGIPSFRARRATAATWKSVPASRFTARVTTAPAATNQRTPTVQQVRVVLHRVEASRSADHDVVGAGLRDRDGLELHRRHRVAVALLAPPHGLTLWSVDY